MGQINPSGRVGDPSFLQKQGQLQSRVFSLVTLYAVQYVMNIALIDNSEISV